MYNIFSKEDIDQMVKQIGVYNNAKTAEEGLGALLWIINKAEGKGLSKIVHVNPNCKGEAHCKGDHGEL